MNDRGAFVVDRKQAVDGELALVTGVLGQKNGDFKKKASRGVLHKAKKLYLQQRNTAVGSPLTNVQIFRITKIND